MFVCVYMCGCALEGVFLFGSQSLHLYLYTYIQCSQIKTEVDRERKFERKSKRKMERKKERVVYNSHYVFSACLLVCGRLLRRVVLLCVFLFIRSCVYARIALCCAPQRSVALHSLYMWGACLCLVFRA